ncbi:MAG: hypothetical protein ABSG82_00890 [Sedimentisphaerales bacterium]|jgi:hypothetical protein
MSETKEPKPSRIASTPHDLLILLDDLCKEETGKLIDEELAKNPHADKAEVMRLFFEQFISGTKEVIASILRTNPGLTAPPYDANPICYLQNVRIWCTELIGKQNLAKLKPAETEQNDTPAKGWGVWIWVKRIPRWIYVLVLFLASLLTCIYFLWWLWTTFWKK